MTRRKHRLPMSAPMVRAIQREIEQPGTGKTQTRRIVKDVAKAIGLNATGFSASPYGQPGDLLAFTETWCHFPRSAPDGMGENLYYRASQVDLDSAKAKMRQCGVKWSPSRFMPYWASRYTGVVTDVRVERVQEISREDSVAEGMEWDSMGWKHYGDKQRRRSSPVQSFQTLWESIHGEGAWARNDWVWVYTFRPIAANVLDVERDPAAYGLGEAA